MNQDDAERLCKTLNERDSEAFLLKEVGSFRAAGTEEAVFDLGGNVAEWTTTKDGKGSVRGGSADAPADAKQRTILQPRAIGAFASLRKKADSDAPLLASPVKKVNGLYGCGRISAARHLFEAQAAWKPGSDVCRAPESNIGSFTDTLATSMPTTTRTWAQSKDQ